LALPTAHQARGIKSYFDISEDCELFFPMTRLEEIFDLYNGLYTILLQPDFDWKENDHLTAVTLLQKHNLESRVKALVHPKTLFTDPHICRFLPATDTSVMAPNYQQDRLALTFTWFGNKDHHPLYQQAMDLFIEVGILEFGAKVHLGKYHSPQPLVKSQYPVTDVKLKINEYDPRHIFQNEYLLTLFSSSKKEPTQLK
jgi:hypothetical protein